MNAGSRIGGHTAAVRCVAFRADSRRLASGAGDGGVLVWDVAGPHPPVAVSAFAHRAPVTSLAWNPAAAEMLATGTADGTAAIWRVVDDRPPHVMAALAGHPGPVQSVAWMPDGQHLCCVFDSGGSGGSGGSGDSRVAIWSAMSETYLGELPDCARLAVSPEGLVATISARGVVTVRDLWRGSGTATRRIPTPVTDCAWSPEGWLALACADGSLELTTPYLDPFRAIVVNDGLLRGVAWAGGGPITGGATSLQAFEMDGRPRWRTPGVLPRVGSLEASGPAVAFATDGDRPHVLELSTGATLLAPALALTAAPAPVPWQTPN